MRRRRGEHWECSECHAVWEKRRLRTPKALRVTGIILLCPKCLTSTPHVYVPKRAAPP